MEAIKPWATCSPSLLSHAAAEVKRRFKIGHVAIQLEPARTPAACSEC